MKNRILIFSLLATLIFAFSVFAQPELYITSYCDLSLESCKVQNHAAALLEQNNHYDIKVDYLYYFDISDPQSSLAHVAVECANKQGMKTEYTEEMQDNLDLLTLAALKQYAENIGLNSMNFTFCLDTQLSAWEVLEQVEEAEEDGITTVPSVRFNKDIYEGPQTYTSLKTLAEKYLGKAVEEKQSLTYSDNTAAIKEESIKTEEPAEKQEKDKEPEEEAKEVQSEEIGEIKEPLFYRAISQIRAWMLGLFQ